MYNVNLTCDLRDNKCKCQIVNQYWSASLKKCLTYRNYTQPCSSVYLCNPYQTNLTCYAASACECPTLVTSNSCDCPPDQYFDQTKLGKIKYTLNP